MPAVLIVEDNRAMREGLEITLGKLGLEVATAGDGPAALELARTRRFELALCDYRLPGGMNGLEFCRQARELLPDLDVIFITAYFTRELGEEAERWLGAVEFQTKPFDTEMLCFRVERVLEARRKAREHERLSEENRALRSEVEEARGYGEIIGRSPSMREVFRTIEQVAASDASVLVTGESGTGKELVAREVHRKSPRREGPFIKVSCAALAEGVLESELFGHEKGAFTGSVKARKGRFELADGGTLFLDEIGDISPMMQVKLLRVLQERQFERVGGEKTLSVDVRLISATNKDLKVEVERGAFREDLFWRLHVVPIELPPLRERQGDIALLAHHLVGRICRRMNRPERPLEPEALAILESHRWPGNVRELENVLERALVLGPGPALRAADLPALGQSELRPALPAGGPIDLNAYLEETERSLIQRCYQQTGGNKSQTARLLGLKTSVLYYKLEKYGIR